MFQVTQVQRPLRRAGFTLVELIVVVAIIAVLVGILLPALAGASDTAKRAKTTAIMDEFAGACDVFRNDHGFYPGLVSDADLIADGTPPSISGTENALLHMMGGYVEASDPAWNTYDNSNSYLFNVGNTSFKVLRNTGGGADDTIPSTMGNGPKINGKVYGPYYTGETGFTTGQAGAPGDFKLPDLIDAWGNPIVYVKRARRVGPLVPDNSGNLGQFLGISATPYTMSTILGESNGNQMQTSVFNASGNANGNGNYAQAEYNFMQLLGHPAFATGDYTNETLDYSAGRGEFVLISAGSDGIYFSRYDGFGSATLPTDEVPNAASVSEWDDIVIVGGGN